MKRVKRIIRVLLCICLLVTMTACGRNEEKFCGHWVGIDMEDGEDFQMDIKEDHSILFTFNGEQEEYSWELALGKVIVKTEGLTFIAEHAKGDTLIVSFVIDSSDMYRFYCRQE